MQKQYVVMIIVLASLCVCYTQTEDFIVKKEKQASTSALKEQMGDYITQSLKMTPLTVGHVAGLQTDYMAICESMLDGSFFTTCSKEDIVSLHAQAQEICQRQEKINELVTAQQEAVQVFKKNHKK